MVRTRGSRPPIPPEEVRFRRQMRRVGWLIVALLSTAALLSFYRWRMSAAGQIFAGYTIPHPPPVVWTDYRGLWASRDGAHTAVAVYTGDIDPGGEQNGAYGFWRHQLVYCDPARVILRDGRGRKRVIPLHPALGARASDKWSVTEVRAYPTGLVLNTNGDCYSVELPGGRVTPIPDAKEVRCSEDSLRLAVRDMEGQLELRKDVHSSRPLSILPAPDEIRDWDCDPLDGEVCVASGPTVTLMQFGRAARTQIDIRSWLYSGSPQTVAIQPGISMVWVTYFGMVGERVAEFSYDGRYQGNVVMIPAFDRIHRPLMMPGARILRAIEANASEHVIRASD